MHQVTLINLSNIDLILHINMTTHQYDHHSLISTSTKCKYFLLHLARFLGHQAIACPSPLLSTSKPFLAIFTISSRQVTSCIKSTIHLYCHLFNFNLASFKYETIPYVIPHVSSTSFYRAWFHIVYGNPTINKPLHEFYLHCCCCA